MCDTSYYQQALAEWRRNHRFSANKPLTAEMLSEVLRRAQELKDAAKSGRPQAVVSLLDRQSADEWDEVT
jgi:hypothetical protein